MSFTYLLTYAKRFVRNSKKCEPKCNTWKTCSLLFKLFTSASKYSQFILLLLPYMLNNLLSSTLFDKFFINFLRKTNVFAFTCQF